LLLCLAWLGGCDWFEEVNSPPTIELVSACPAPGDVLEGGSVTFKWEGADFDGEVASYQWSFDGGAWISTTADSAVIDEVAAGDHTFMVRALDNTGDASADAATCAFTVFPRGVERVVLVELFTTNVCKNCPNAEGALMSLLAEIGPARLAVVAYHDKPADAPNSDGLATDESDARIGWYTTDTNYFPEQWPVAVFDGLHPVAGAETVDGAATLYDFEITGRRDLPSPIRLELAGDIGASSGNVAASLKVAGRLPADQLVLHFVVVEDEVNYNGYFAKMFDFVTRDILDDYPVTLAAVGDSVRVDRAFPVEAGWNAANLDVIAFVQDTATREVIQAARLRHE
jgi:hypothetical protein